MISLKNTRLVKSDIEDTNRIICKSKRMYHRKGDKQMGFFTTSVLAQLNAKEHTVHPQAYFHG
ncbi:MAG: hypothetical protein PUF29_06920 [Anaerobutyricum hallii]|uniref:hypothetical protein n=1 Tax=Anaerobutyricum hallii TaxID=39488 RepID=UPI00242F032C|nr:hypothetical protein [Anaerobutyricum hallii]MDD6588323.1 hypothetical protein [Anaerobutyricum hallii]